MKKIIIVLSFLFFYGVSANMTICDSGQSLTEECLEGQIINDITSIDSFSGNLQDIANGFFGNKFNSSFSKDAWIPNGFLGTKRDRLSPYFATPVGLFSNYKTTELVLPAIPVENDFSNYPLVKPKSGGGGGNYAISSCRGPDPITNISISIKNNGIEDYININFLNPKGDKVKVIRNSPSFAEFNLTTDRFNDFGLYDGNYSYFVVPYNDCIKSGIYSDLISIKYVKKIDETKPILKINKNEFSIYIPKDIKLKENTSIKMLCNGVSEVLINDFFTNGKYIIDNKYFNKNFSCRASFYDFDGKYFETNQYLNIAILDKYLKELDLINFLGVDKDNIFSKLYLGILNLNEKNYATFGKASYYLSTILGENYIGDENLSYDFLKSTGFIKEDDLIDNKIEVEKFIKILLYFNENKSKFRNELSTFLDNNFGNKKYNLIVRDTIKAKLINKKLNFYKKTDKNSYSILLECINGEKCQDISILDFLKNDIADKIKLNQNIDLNSYKDYIKLAYFTIGYDIIQTKKYDINDYNKFIDILTEAVILNDDFYDKKLSYENYLKLNYSLTIDSNLVQEIEYLTDKHIDKIINLYNSSKKEDLLELIREYLGE